MAKTKILTEKIFSKLFNDLEKDIQNNIQNMSDEEWAEYLKQQRKKRENNGKD